MQHNSTYNGHTKCSIQHMYAIATQATNKQNIYPISTIKLDQALFRLKPTKAKMKEKQQKNIQDLTPINHTSQLMYNLPHYKYLQQQSNDEKVCGENEQQLE